MARIPKASTLLPKICLLLITAINIAAADRRSVLTELYQQAAEQNRPLILVVDNHSKDEGAGHQGHGVYRGSKHVSDEAIPLHYMRPRASASSPKSLLVKEKKSEAKIDLIKYYLSRLLTETQSGGLKKKSVRSDDRDEDLNLDNRNYYRDERDRRDRRERYRDRDTDAKYNRKPSDRYYRPRGKLEDRDHYDRERYDRDRRDRYRSDRNREDRDREYRYREDRYRDDRYREDRNRLDRYRSEKDRLDRNRADKYRQDRNRERDNYVDLYRDDRDRYQYQSQNKYQPPVSKDRYTDNYGANVIKNLLRYSNNLNCAAKSKCKKKCYQRSRMLRKNGDNCEDICDAQYECEESGEKEEKEDKKDDGCDARGSDESCGDVKNDNMSTKGYTDNGGEEEENCKDDRRC